MFFLNVIACFSLDYTTPFNPLLRLLLPGIRWSPLEVFVAHTRTSWNWTLANWALARRQRNALLKNACGRLIFVPCNLAVPSTARPMFQLLQRSLAEMRQRNEREVESIRESYAARLEVVRTQSKEHAKEAAGRDLLEQEEIRRLVARKSSCMVMWFSQWKKQTRSTARNILTIAFWRNKFIGLNSL